jgi:hypothetical protein
MRWTASHTVAFGFGFLIGALLLAMLMGLQVRVYRAHAEQFRQEAEASQQQAMEKGMHANNCEAERDNYGSKLATAEQRLRQVEKELESARSKTAEKKD